MAEKQGQQPQTKRFQITEVVRQDLEGAYETVHPEAGPNMEMWNYLSRKAYSEGFAPDLETVWREERFTFEHVSEGHLWRQECICYITWSIMTLRKKVG